jgi:hypothetical protein
MDGRVKNGCLQILSDNRLLALSVVVWLLTGWPDEFVKNHPNGCPTPFCQNLLLNLSIEYMWDNSVIFKEVLKVSNWMNFRPTWSPWWLIVLLLVSVVAEPIEAFTDASWCSPGVTNIKNIFTKFKKRRKESIVHWPYLYIQWLSESLNCKIEIYKRKKREKYMYMGKVEKVGILPTCIMHNFPIKKERIHT